MIKLYGMDVSFPVNRVRLCLNALDLDYEFIRVSPMAGDTQTEEYLKMSPAGKVPAIDVDGFSLFESNAIMKYLCRKYDSNYYPKLLEAQAKVDSWCDFSVIHVANGIGKILFNKILAPMIDADVDERSLQDGYDFTKRFFGVVDTQLAHSNYLAGDELSIADFSLLATVDPVEVLDIDMSQYPNLDSWHKKLVTEEFHKKLYDSYAAALEVMKRAMA